VAFAGQCCQTFFPVTAMSSGAEMPSRTALIHAMTVTPARRAATRIRPRLLRLDDEHEVHP